MKKSDQKKYNFFQKFYASFTSTDFYIRIFTQNFGRTILYVLGLIAILSIIIGSTEVIESQPLFNNLEAAFNDSRFPEHLIIKNGQLELTPNNDLEIKSTNPDNFIIIIDSGDKKNYTQVTGHKWGFFLNKDYLVFANKHGYTPIKFADLPDGTIKLPLSLFAGDNLKDSIPESQNLRIPLNKSTFTKFLPIIKISTYIIGYFIYFLVSIFSYLIKGLFIYGMLSLTFPIFQVKQFGIKSSQIFTVIAFAMSLPTAIYEIFSLSKISSDFMAIILLVGFYVITLKIVRTALSAILIDKFGSSFNKDSKWL